MRFSLYLSVLICLPHIDTVDLIPDFNSIMSSKKTKSKIRKLKKTNEHFQLKRGQYSKVHQLQKYLQCEKMKMMGLSFMTPKALVFNNDKFIDNCLKWLHTCASVEDLNDFIPALDNMQLLIKKSATYPELNGPVSHFIRSNFLIKFFNYFTCYDEGWKCVELCLIYYRGSCNAHKERLKIAADYEIQKKIITPTIARVYALLPIISDSGNDGINLTDKWKYQFEHIITICISVLHDLFRDVTEVECYDHLSYEKYTKSKTPDQQFLHQIFHNYCSILRSMLVCSFPAPKTIAPQKVFDMICRCLNVSCRTLGNLVTTQQISLISVLPHFHISVYSLLNDFIATSKTNLLPYSFLMSKLMNQTIQSTQSPTTVEMENAYLHLRLLVYETWRKWLLTCRNCGSVDFHTLALAAVNEISESALPVSDIPPCSMESIEQKFDINNSLKTMICISVIKALQVYIRYVGPALQTKQIKAIQMCVINNILEIQRACTLKIQHCSSTYRCEMYSLLMELVNCQSPKWATPINWGVELLKQGTHDASSKVSNFCSSSLINIRNIIDQEVIRMVAIDETPVHSK